LLPENFVYCISNHDQVGNRALGERLNHLVKPATYRAASALLLLVPYTPLLFMGQEWGASTPFQYFTDHNEELGALVEKGRKEEFADAFAAHEELAETFPSPQAEETFRRSKLNWEEVSQEPYAGILSLYREAIRLRKQHAEFRPRQRDHVKFAALSSGVLAMRVTASGPQDGEWLLLCDLQGGHSGNLVDDQIAHPPQGAKWKPELSTSEARFGGSGRSSFDAESASFDFAEAEVLVLRADTSAA
jgi:maltooligosyltrehalose trehalohydrolase